MVALTRSESVQAGLGLRQRRWYALFVICAGALMVVLDTTVVNVALPSIRADLGFTEGALVWVVNAYMLTFGGSMLLGGRLGDLYGQRRVFMAGIALFTCASLACASATTVIMLIAARAVQGLGGAVIAAVALALIMNLFSDEAERAKAIGIYGFVSAGGGGAGLLLGGAVTGALNWHWIFGINLPVGLFILALCRSLLPAPVRRTAADGMDVWGALSITGSLMLVVYGIVNGGKAGWRSPETLGTLGAALALFGCFVWVERRVPDPLVPFSIFRIRSLAVANVVRVLWSAGASPLFFLSSLYLQVVLGYGPLETGLVFLPVNVITALFSLRLSSMLVERFGSRKSLAAGMVLATAGLALLTRLPVDGSASRDVIPGLLLVAAGGGMAFIPLMLATMRDVTPSESGLASGIVNTSAILGNSLGLAIVASIAAARTQVLLLAGGSTAAALTSGYRLAFSLGAICACTASVLGIAMLRDSAETSHNGTTGSRFAKRGLRCGSGKNHGAEPHTKGSRR